MTTLWTHVTDWTRRVFHRPTRLRAPSEPTSFIGLLLVIVQSAALVLVFGHSEIFRLFAHDLNVVVVAGVSLFVLVASTLACDLTVKKAIGRIGPLRRMQEDALAAWLIAYVGFVLAVEGGTFGVALWAVEQRPDALFSSAPLLPNEGFWLLAQIVLRALMLSTTFVVLQAVAGKLPIGYEVAIAEARALVGGMMQGELANARLHAGSLASLMQTWGRLNQPLPRKRTRWNDRAIARDAEYAQRLQAQTEMIVTAFRELTHDEAAEMQATLERERAQLAASAQERERQQRSDLLTALLYASQTGALPPTLVEQYPELDGVTFAPARGGGAGRSGGNGSGGAPRTRGGRIEQFLASCDCAVARRPAGSKKVWMRSGDVGKLVRDDLAGSVTADMLRKLVRTCGEGALDGVSLIAPVETLLSELQTRHWLSETAQETWARLVGQSGEHDALSARESAAQGTANGTLITGRFVG